LKKTFLLPLLGSALSILLPLTLSRFIREATGKLLGLLTLSFYIGRSGWMKTREVVVEGERRARGEERRKGEERREKGRRDVLRRGMER